MNDGWVKLHRQTMYNEVFRHDRTAWHVFEVLLLVVDKRTGKWSGGRKQLAGLCDMNENTLYKAVLRLESQQMVNRFSNTKYSVYSICKWKDFQSVGNRFGNVAVTTQQHSNKNKKKNIYIINEKRSTVELTDFERQKAREQIAKLRNQLTSKRMG